MIKKYRILLVLALVVLVGGFSFFYRMYQYDMKSLQDFVVSYQTFDRTIADFADDGTSDSESKASDALTKLTAKAGVRISSLIRNDSLIPPATLQVADLAEKELESLKAYKNARQNKNTNVNNLLTAFNDLMAERKAAYDSFQKLDSS